MGTTVVPGLGPGLGMDIDPFDPQYEQKVLIAKNAAAVAAQNASNAAAYAARAKQLKEANIQQQADKLPLLTLEPPPHKKLLSADGLSIVDSTDLVSAPISVIPDPPTDAPPPQGTFPVSSTPAADRTDRLIQMVTSLKLDLNAIKAKLGI